MRSQALCHPIVSECLWAFHVGRLQLSQLAHSSLLGRWSATRASPPRPRVSDYLCLILLVLSLNAFDLKVNFPTKPAHNPPLFVSDKFFSMHLFVTATPIKHLHILKKFLLVVATCLANISFPPSAPHLHCPSCCVRWDLGSRVPSVSPTLSSHRGPALEALISALSRTQPCTNHPGTVRPWAVPLAPLSVPVLPRSASHLLFSVTLLTSHSALCTLLACTVCALLPRPCALSLGLCWLSSRWGPVMHCCSGGTARYSLSFLCVSWKIMLPFWVHFFYPRCYPDTCILCYCPYKKEISNAYEK